MTFVGGDVSRRQPKFAPKEVEAMAALEHGRWVLERLAAGCAPGPEEDVAARINPSLVSWKKLPARVKQLDRNAIGCLCGDPGQGWL